MVLEGANSLVVPHSFAYVLVDFFCSLILWIYFIDIKTLGNFIHFLCDLTVLNELHKVGRALKIRQYVGLNILNFVQR